jgi:hypothetical protein
MRAACLLGLSIGQADDTTAKMSGDELTNERQHPLAHACAALKRPAMRRVHARHGRTAARESRQKAGVRRMRVNDLGCEIGEGSPKVVERGTLPQGRAGRPQGRHHDNADAAVATDLHCRAVCSSNDDDVVSSCVLHACELEDVSLGATDIALRDDVDDSHHQPTASIHADCHLSNE